MYHTGDFYVFLTLYNCDLVQEIVVILPQLRNLSSHVMLDALFLLHTLVEHMVVTHEALHSGVVLHHSLLKPPLTLFLFKANPLL